MTSELIEHAELAGLMRSATHEVFSTMLGMSLEELDFLVESEPNSSQGGVLSLIGFTGRWMGTGSFLCTPSTACRIADALFLTEHSSVEDEVMDGIAEMTNMILGNVKTELEERLGPMLLSIPTVIYGRNFVKRSLTRRDWVVVPFVHEGDRIEIHLCLAENPNPEPVRSTHSRPYSLHV
jgi:chemotaxis protein CheX